MRLLLRLALLGALAASAAPAGAETVTLRYKFVPNELAVYHQESRVRGTSVVPDGKGGMMTVPMEMTMAFDGRQRVLGVTPKGVATIRNLFVDLGGSMRTTVDGHTYERISDAKKTRVFMDGKEMPSEPRPSSKPGMGFLAKPYIITMDSRGNVVSTGPQPAKAEGLLKQMLQGMPFPPLNKQQWGVMRALPGNPVSVGDTWTRADGLPMPGFAKAIQLKVTYRLAAIERDETGRRVAVIESSGETPSGEQGEVGSVDHRMRGLIRWDVDGGNLVRADTSAGGTVSLPTPGGPGAMTMSFEVSASTVRK